MVERVIEILTGPLLIAQFGVVLIALLWSFLSVDTMHVALIDAMLNAAQK